jgi:hypothetical protein
VYALWNAIVAPALEAARAARVVEIGAFRGATTVRLAASLGPRSELDVIDPLPQFDHDAVAHGCRGSFRLHEATSHEVLPGLPPADAVLVDGDHNWFTVLGELRLLATTARRAGAPLPLVVMHDVGWPYGRRDGYYAPERVPAEHRRPHAARGIMPGCSELVDSGGLNAHLENALTDGGPRNGVLTALEDFAAECERELRIVVLPLDYGVALAADADRLDTAPGLAALLDGFESAATARWASWLRLLGRTLVDGGHVDEDALAQIRADVSALARDTSAPGLVVRGDQLGAAMFARACLDAYGLHQLEVVVDGADREEVAIALARFGFAEEALTVRERVTAVG